MALQILANSCLRLPFAITCSSSLALGGLAGNNAHGAGFLQAAIDAGVKPARGA